MNRVLRLVVAASICLSLFPVRGQAQQEDSLWWNRSRSFVVPIGDVTVEGRRPMKEIGVQQTRLEEPVLRNHIASSMAEVLTFGSSIFVKQHGRATLSTVAFRGTSPSHTQVAWNGLKIQSPMLGTTDFSLIPSYLMDGATLLHGSSSVSETGGGLGGAILLKSAPSTESGFGLQYVQGIGSYSTYDEFLRLSYANDRWQVQTRLLHSLSENDFHYTNYKKSELIYDSNHQVVGSYHPTETNRNCDFRDLHLMQEVAHTLPNGDRLGLEAWYLDSRRGVPMLMVDYNDERDFLNEQRERTLRSVVSWQRLATRYKAEARAGYVYSWQAYDFSKDRGNGIFTELIRSRNRMHTLYGQGHGEFYAERWLFTATLSLHHHLVESRDERSLQGEIYDRGRTELSLAASARWSPTERLGLALILREELYDRELSPLIPALSADYLLSKRGRLTLKGSLSRNYRYPTLNDLYFEPGGNPELNPERGLSYDAGLSFHLQRQGRYSLSGSATWFDSYIDDWIIWQATPQGYWTPRNLKKVHAYGVELHGEWLWHFARDWQLQLVGNFAWTPSINESDPSGAYDQSVGKQLIYQPEYSASVGAEIAWRTWRLGYKGNYYSERYTTSSNSNSPLGVVAGYYVCEASLEKLIPLSWADFSAKLNARNLFDREYESVLARPMPGIHFEFFLGIRPKWGKKRE
ncbi:MAG: TonB-dependent receptor [Rikenellaceae bacterium]|nr:TonB-dependent receptor [Rikenellaceae bacterium]